MVKKNLDDELIIAMYNDGEPINDIKDHFGTCHETIYRHLSWHGIYPNRRTASAWTLCEEERLLDALHHGATGEEYVDYVPTRTMYACKGHIRCWNEQRQ